MKPFFSIIVPCCDVEPFVRNCLDSVRNQPFSSWECLIGVETSKDNTESIAREYEARDSRFKVFTGPRSGSCSASRNTGIDMAQGEYIIFLDGDDAIADGSLQRLHDKIDERPGADIYPCAIRAIPNVNQPNMSEKDREQIWDSYPGVATEMTGPEATIHFYRLPIFNPMLQISVFRCDFLRENNLKCIHGLRGQDVEFSPRALYLAKRIIPLHEVYYHYFFRSNSVSRSKHDADFFYPDRAIIFRSLLAFYANVSKAEDFDRRIAAVWGKCWIGKICFEWFFPSHIDNIPRQRRLETLSGLFADGFEVFEELRKAASVSARLTGWWIRVFVTRPFWRGLSEMFFKAYFAMHRLKNSIPKHKGAM